MDLNEFYSRHERVALMFSGGRDSIACLHLIEPYLDRTLVIWVNTQANFPEIESLMEGVRALVPRFLEVVSDQPASIAANGYPSDVVPTSFTAWGQQATAPKDIKIRSLFECCAENLWYPAAEAIKELGVTGVIRGQRRDEAIRGVIESGHVFEDVEYLFPIQEWSAEDVLAYLKEKDVVIDDRLNMAHSSLDCWNCTAFCNSSPERANYVKQKHPEKFEQVVKIMKQIDNAISSDRAGLRKILEI